MKSFIGLALSFGVVLGSHFALAQNADASAEKHSFVCVYIAVTECYSEGNGQFDEVQASSTEVAWSVQEAEALVSKTLSASNWGNCFSVPRDLRCVQAQ